MGQPPSITIVDRLPPCASCKHFNNDNPYAETCAAFRGGIPKEILFDGNQHTEPFEGDNGIQYEEIE